VLTKFVHLYSCNNITTLKTAGIPAKTSSWEYGEYNTSQILECILLVVYIFWIWLMHRGWNILQRYMYFKIFKHFHFIGLCQVTVLIYAS